MVWGVLIAIVGVAAAIFAVMNLSGRPLSIIGWIVAVAMVVLLALQNNRLIELFELRGETDRQVENVEDLIGSIVPGFTDEYVLSGTEAAILSFGMKQAYPSLSRHIHASDFEGRNGAQVADELKRILRKSTSRELWNRIGWVALILAAGIALMAVTAGKGASGKQRRSAGTSSYHPHDDF